MTTSSPPAEPPGAEATGSGYFFTSSACRGQGPAVRGGSTERGGAPAAAAHHAALVLLLVLAEHVVRELLRLGEGRARGSGAVRSERASSAPGLLPVSLAGGAASACGAPQPHRVAVVRRVEELLDPEQDLRGRGRATSAAKKEQKQRACEAPFGHEPGQRSATAERESEARRRRPRGADPSTRHCSDGAKSSGGALRPHLLDTDARPPPLVGIQDR